MWVHTHGGKLKTIRHSASASQAEFDAQFIEIETEQLLYLTIFERDGDVRHWIEDTGWI
jgi:hypothetical protein